MAVEHPLGGTGGILRTTTSSRPAVTSAIAVGARTFQRFDYKVFLTAALRYTWPSQRTCGGSLFHAPRESVAGNGLISSSVGGTSALCGAPVTITTISLSGGVVGSVSSQTLTATGGTAPYFWTVSSGRLPAGLSLNSVTGQITGMPTYPEASIVTFQVTDSSIPTQTATAVLVLTIASNTLTITTTSLPNGQVGVPYSQTLQTMGGTAPLTWALNPGAALPPGLTLNAITGQISGTPTAAVANYRFLVQVTDSTTPIPQAGTVAFFLTITN